MAQTRHRFLFGNIAFGGYDAIALANGELSGAELERAERLDADWHELFNLATLPFYWAGFEPQRGRPDTARLLVAARRLAERGVRLKGHPLCWHTLAPDWLLGLADEEIVDAQVARIEREVGDFAALIDAWDVLNEVVIMPLFERHDNGITRISRRLGRVGIAGTMVEAARAANPGATLLINDFDLSADYEHLIEECLAAGVYVDALGLQSHMHQGWWGIEKVLDVLDRFSRFGLPLHFTETSLVSGHLMPPSIVDLNDYVVDEWPTTPEGEVRQAVEAAAHYETLFTHPSVEAITWWGLPDGGWLKAPSGLVRADGSRKPAYEALRALIKGEWWLPPTRMGTDEAGRLRFSGFLGDYELSWPGGSGSTVPFSLDAPGPASIGVRID